MHLSELCSSCIKAELSKCKLEPMQQQEACRTEEEQCKEKEEEHKEKEEEHKEKRTV